jgi:hypothetical protein
MLVGVVKLAPSLPLDGNLPFLHLERKFMHLGFHIYDVGFQSPNVGRPTAGLRDGAAAGAGHPAAEHGGDPRAQRPARKIQRIGNVSDSTQLSLDRLASPELAAKPAAAGKAGVRVKGLNLFYDEVQALKDIELDIPERQVTAFIGPSGCGKSTLLRCFNRMNDLIDGCRVKGKILIGGKNIQKKKVDVAELRRRVGMVFQKPNPFPKSVYENVGPAGGGAVGRGQGPAAGACVRPVRRAAAEAGHRPRHCRTAAGDPAGRAVLGARPHLHPQGRGTDPRAQAAVHNHHCDA